jgi:hypothetical protein
MAQVVEQLSSKHEAQNSKVSTTKQKQKQKMDIYSPKESCNFVKDCK